MKTKRKTPKKERAAHLGQQAAPKYYLQSKSYRKTVPVSTLKSEIGELLFCLQFPVGQEVSQIGWMLFERMLRRHMGLVVPPKCLSEPLQSTISRQGVSG